MNFFTKKTFLASLCMVILGLSVTTATNNTELLEQLEALEQSEQYEKAKQLTEKLEFESFSSCEDMGSVLTDFLEDNADSFQHMPYYRGGWIEDDLVDFAVEESAVMDMAASDAPQAVATAKSAVGSSTNDVSTTNVQVQGVDEPDILKTDGEYLYYFNQGEKKIDIIQSPLDRSTSTIDINAVDVVSTIRIPKTFSNVQLFLQSNKLVVLGQRWKDGQYGSSLLERNSRVDIIIYDVSDVANPTLERFTDLDGNYQDARLIDNELYVVTQLSVNRWNAWEMLEGGEKIVMDDLIPQAIDVAYKKDGQKDLEIGGKTYPYGINVEKSGCDDVLYVLPTSETLKEANIMPSFTVIRKVSIDDAKSDIETTTTFGSTQTVHMTKDSLYLADSIWFNSPVSCPPNARCILPWFGGGESNTLLHKFDVRSRGLDYRASTLVPGNPLTQYSMSEDSRGNFRLITQTWSPHLDTHLFVLDDDLVLEGMVRNIQKNEEFKSSRFIGNKLYMVTFERTDPLFVIDIADTANPEIIGELKIPGYSTYLHPYAAAADGKQYLIGLGYDTTENQRGGIITNGVKVDLYEVDYTTRDDEGMIDVSQKYTTTYGEQGSRSEALENPRMVVWDEARNMLVIPMLLQDREATENCNIEYKDGLEVSRRCYDTFRNETTFAGLKALTIDKDTGISERASYDFEEQLRKNIKNDYGGYEEESMPTELNQRTFRQLMFRVGYAGDALYSLNNSFGFFTIIGTNIEKTLSFTK